MKNQSSEYTQGIVLLCEAAIQNIVCPWNIPVCYGSCMVAYIDDILVTGLLDEERLKALYIWDSEPSGLRAQLKKCKFMTTILVIISTHKDYIRFWKRSMQSSKLCMN